MAWYDHKEIEKKWQERWEEAGAFRADSAKASEMGNLYVLDMFPYPSGAGLHVGHPEGYTATDIVCRKRRMEGWNVLHPMGWDAFGLPAENYAIKQGGHPKEITAANIDNFRRQIKSLGFSYDWDREISTADPSYYKWTQWLFLILHAHDLAYRAKAPVNWCPSCQTVLANEQVADGACERCGTEVVRKDLDQWFFRITKYADRLLAGLDSIDWPEKIKAMQRNWIGKSEGVEIDFAVAPHGSTQEAVIPVFTTRPDTLFGVSYLVLAPEHPLVDVLTASEFRDDIVRYRDAARHKSELERTHMEKDKTGIAIGAAAIHPLTGEEIPIWVADYALMGYGTGAVMGVPAHDARDWAFAERYGLEAKHVIAPMEQDARIESLAEAYAGPGILVNSGAFDGLTNEDAKQKIADALESASKGRRVTNYRVRDWLVARQRYWGAPIPIIWCETCGAVPVDAKDLPVVLPDDVDFKPTGESPLARSASFHDVACPSCGQPARRESDTMDTFVDSSWYYLRYTDPKNADAFADPDAISAWCPVDLYVGGAEHAVLHLLYSRFIAYALHDLGYLPFEEPFLKLRNQGLILGPDGEKMSKSRGNVINPDEIVAEYGADTLRLYEMFMGPFEDQKPWDTKGVVGIRRFLDKVWTLAERVGDADDAELAHELARTVKKVGEDIEVFKFNTAIAQMMKFSNAMQSFPVVPREAFRTFVRLLAPFAPHLAEELWSAQGEAHSVFEEAWPAYDAGLAKESLVDLAVQVNGKLRGTVSVSPDLSEVDARARAEAQENVAKHLEGKEVVKVVYVPGRMINFVVKL